MSEIWQNVSKNQKITTNVAIEMKIKQKSAGIYQNIPTITTNKGLYDVYYLKQV